MITDQVKEDILALAPIAKLSVALLIALSSVEPGSGINPNLLYTISGLLLVSWSVCGEIDQIEYNDTI